MVEQGCAWDSCAGALSPVTVALMTSETESRMNHQDDGRIRQFKRIVMSFADFDDASKMSSYIIENRLYDEFDRNRLMISSMNCAMIISYCRPFSGNDSRNSHKVPDLGKKALREFSSSELTLHNSIMEKRNTLLAHSDSDAINLKFIRREFGSHMMLQPTRNWSMAPLPEDSLHTFNIISNKLLTYVATQRLKLEKEIEPLLRDIDMCSEIEEKEYGVFRT